MISMNEILVGGLFPSQVELPDFSLCKIETLSTIVRLVPICSSLATIFVGSCCEPLFGPFVSIHISMKA